MRTDIRVLLAAWLACAPLAAVAQDVINPQTNASALTTGTVATGRGGAGTITGALKGNGSGTVSQAATADLSDYVQSTCTVTFQGSSTAGTGQTYNNQGCSYERIGRDLIVRFDLNMAGLGTAAGNVQIGGLPVASGGGGTPGTCSFGFVNLAGTSPPAGILGFVSSGNSFVDVYGFGSASATLTVTQAGATFRAMGTCIYRTS